MANKVTAAKARTSGGVYVAPAGTALPTDASSSLAEAYKTLGHISADGVTNSNSPSTSSVKDWRGETVLVLYNSKDDTFKFKLIDGMSDEVLKFIYGADNVSSSGSTISVEANNDDIKAAVIVIDMILKDNKLKRIVIPAGCISSIGDIVYNGNDAIGYDVTVTATKITDAAGEELPTHYEYMTV